MIGRSRKSFILNSFQKKQAEVSAQLSYLYKNLGIEFTDVV